MPEFDRLPVWEDRRLAARLGWYRQVALGERPAKHLIARRVPVRIALDAPEEVLWGELERRTPEFLELWRDVRQGRQSLTGLPRAGTSLVDLCVELSRRMLAHCNFCRWNCRVDRSTAAKYGTCQLAAETRVGSYFHHRGEELVYRGTEGSGTIFFTSCNMRCSFCQNGDISTDKDNGTPVSARQLALMARRLRLEGCHNVNWVGGDPTIHLHSIVEAISLVDGEGAGAEGELQVLAPRSELFGVHRVRDAEAFYGGELNVPMLWNSNFFMSGETMKILRLLMDVWLPDLKFGPGKCSVKLARTPWYWETVTGNLKAIHGWGEDFTIRHLVMPNHVDCCTVPVLEWIAKEMPDAPVNVMDQYHPDTFCDPRSPRYKPKYEEISRRATAAEIRSAYRHARDLGLCFESLSYEKNLTGLQA